MGGPPGAVAGLTAGRALHEFPTWAGLASADSPIAPTVKGTPGRPDPQGAAKDIAGLGSPDLNNFFNNRVEDGFKDKLREGVLALPGPKQAPAAPTPQPQQAVRRPSPENLDAPKGPVGGLARGYDPMAQFTRTDSETGQRFLINPNAPGKELRLSTRDWQGLQQSPGGTDRRSGGLAQQMQDWQKRLGYSDDDIAQVLNWKGPKGGVLAD